MQITFNNKKNQGNKKSMFSEKPKHYTYLLQPLFKAIVMCWILLGPSFVVFDITYCIKHKLHLHKQFRKES